MRNGVFKCDGIFRVIQEKNTSTATYKLGPIPTGANPTSSFAYADSLNVRDSQAVQGLITYMPDAMGVATNSSAAAS